MRVSVLTYVQGLEVYSIIKHLPEDLKPLVEAIPEEVFNYMWDKDIMAVFTNKGSMSERQDMCIKLNKLALVIQKFKGER